MIAQTADERCKYEMCDTAYPSQLKATVEKGQETSFVPAELVIRG